VEDPAPAADPLAEIAEQKFGVKYLYPLQRYVVSNTLEGRDQIVVLPTGAGKSLCFQLPALLLPGPTLVLVPLLSLMADQMRRLSASGAPAGVLRGGLTSAERDALFAGLTGGELRILLATPEACLVPSTEERLAACRFAHFVVDEAHCVCEWGRSFRPAYRELGGLCGRLGSPCTTAFTATASPEVLADVRAQLFPGREPGLVETSPDRPNISYAVLPTLSRLHSLEGLLRGRPGPSVVFCRTRKGAERTARELALRMPERDVRFYHAGLDAAERKALEGWFLPSREGTLCATSAWGMGMDKPDIRTVVHREVPPSVEAYLQETGRAGRDGEPSRAILLFSPGDEGFPAALADETARRRSLAILGYARGAGVCRRQALLSLIGKEAPPCAGCDVCAGTAAGAPEGRAEMLAFAAAHRRRFTPREAAAVLCGVPGPAALRSFRDREPGWGLLAGWRPEDCEEALEGLIAGGGLSRVRWGPWRGRVSTA
jgi:ATP-dependent DNA helicase RecQ